MQNISEIYINDFRLLNNFSFELNNNKEKLNIYLLMGKNGSGKSTFIDALYNIASTQKNPDKFPNYKICCGNTRILGILGTSSKTSTENSEILWHKSVRFYTGHSARNIDYQVIDNEDNFSFDVKNIKYVLTAVCLSGHWNAPENKDIIEEITKLVFMEKGILVPKTIWLDVKNYNPDTFDIKIDGLEISTLMTDKHITRLSINIENLSNITSSFSILHTLMTRQNDVDNQVIDTGFLYKKEDISTKTGLLRDNTLSDGELGLIQRMALILLFKELKSPEERSILLLDEPETHFNELWKQSFIYLVKKILKDTYHDVFIATHSAILATDAKPDELYKFELHNNKVKVLPIQFRLYGSNVCDVSNILFNIEGDAGKRSKEELDEIIKSNDSKNINKIRELLNVVGPGEYRWRLRAKLSRLEAIQNCGSDYCPLTGKKINDEK